MIQVVCVHWGDKYGADSINRIHRAVLRYATDAIRFVAIAETKLALHPDIVQLGYPAFPLPFEEMKAGCRAKLAVFAPGLLDPDLPTIYLDLDTVILGDVRRMVAELEASPGLFMLRNHFLEWWKLPGWIKRLAGRKYYFGNSSILGFYPRQYRHIFDRFNDEAAKRQSPLPKHMRSDERFISYCAGYELRTFSTRVANKFAEEYMMPFATLEELRKRLPWVRRRRSELVALTFVSHGLKPDKLVQFRRGDLLRYKGAKVWWDHDRYAAFYREPM